MFETALLLGFCALAALVCAAGMLRSAPFAEITPETWGETLDVNDPRFLDLQTLWSTAKVGSGAEEFKRGWRTVLVAMFTHPSFIGY